MNKIKGEVKIVLGGTEYIMRPTFEALVEIEDRLQASIYEIVSKMEKSNALPIKSATAVIHAGIRAAWTSKKEDPPTFKEIGEIVFESGLHNFMEPVLAFLVNAVAGGEAPGNASPTQQKTTT